MLHANPRWARNNGSTCRPVAVIAIGKHYLRSQSQGFCSSRRRPGTRCLDNRRQRNIRRFGHRRVVASSTLAAGIAFQLGLFPSLSCHIRVLFHAPVRIPYQDAITIIATRCQSSVGVARSSGYSHVHETGASRLPSLHFILFHTGTIG
jgi:hypothetical protein